MTKLKRNMYIVAIILATLCVGISYAFFSGKVKNNNQTQTVIKSNSLNLIFTGDKEITTGTNIIPGDSFTKTFNVENISSTKTTYNIYIENITNGFNDDLVYELADENGTIIEEKALPKSKKGKSYLKYGISINPSEKQNYTMTIKYKYLDEDQSVNMGKTFSGTVGIDAENSLAINHDTSYSMYSWNQNIMSDYYIDYAIEFLEDLDVTNVYQSFKVENFTNSRVKGFINELADHGINTYFLDGAPYYYNDPELIKTKIDLIYDYNQNLSGTDARIKGLVLDIEPYGDNTYTADVGNGFITYVNTVKTVSEYARSKGIELVNIIPNWYNVYKTANDVSDTVKPQIDSLLDTLIQVADKTEVMAYNKENILVDMDEEIAIAKKYNKKISCVSEFSRTNGTGNGNDLTYWVEKSPLTQAVNNWNDVYDKYEYANLSFSYHFLEVIMEMKTNHTLKKHIITFKDESGNLITYGDVIIKSNNKSIYDYISDYGKIDFVLDPTKEYSISVEGYNTVNVQKVKEEDNSIIIECTLAKKENYQLEAYPVIIADSQEKTIQEGKVYITDTNTNITKEYNVGTGYYFFANPVPSDTAYEVRLEYQGKEYKLINAVANSNTDNKASIINDKNQMIIPSGFNSSLYLGSSLYFTEK